MNIYFVMFIHVIRIQRWWRMTLYRRSINKTTLLFTNINMIPRDRIHLVHENGNLFTFDLHEITRLQLNPYTQNPLSSETLTKARLRNLQLPLHHDSISNKLSQNEKATSKLVGVIRKYEENSLMFDINRWNNLTTDDLLNFISNLNGNGNGKEIIDKNKLRSLAIDVMNNIMSDRDSSGYLSILMALGQEPSDEPIPLPSDVEDLFLISSWLPEPHRVLELQPQPQPQPESQFGAVVFDSDPQFEFEFEMIDTSREIERWTHLQSRPFEDDDHDAKRTRR